MPAIFINGIPVINNLNQAQDYNVNLNKYEMVSQSLYDSAAYPALGVQQLTFFQNPIGAGVGVFSGVPKTREDTNMQAAGSMPAMQAYIVSSIELDIQADVPIGYTEFNGFGPVAEVGPGQAVTFVNDMWFLRVAGFLQFQIGSKYYISEGPLMKFPASNDFEIGGAGATTSTPTANGLVFAMFGKAVGPAYELAPNNLLLIPNQNFAVTCNWTNLRPVTNPARIFCRLMGTLLRAAQ